MNKEISLTQYLKELLNKIWIVIMLTVICGAMLFVYSFFFATPMYTSSAKMYVSNKQDTSTSISGTDLTAREKLVRTYAEIINSNTLLQMVCDKIDAHKSVKGYEYLQSTNYTPASLKSIIDVEAANETEVFYIRAKTPSPELSQFIIEAITEYLPGEISRIMEASSANLIDKADLPSAPSSPNIFRNTLIGALVGFVIAAAIVFIIFRTDTVVRNETDLTEAFDDLIVLGAIPLMHMETDNKTTASNSSTRADV